jgi:predicted PurR-regulated permease PerM
MREPQIIENPDVKPAPSQPPREHITISLSLRTMCIVFGVLLTIWIIRELSSTLLIFAGAVLLATAVDKPVAWMQTRGIPRSIGILMVFAVVIGLLVAVVAVLIPLVTSEASRFVDQIGDYETRLEHLLRRLGISTNIRSGVSVDQIGTNVSNHVTTIASGLTSVALGVGHAAVVLFAMLVIAFMLAMDPTAGTRFARRFLTNDAHARLTRITGDVDGRIGGWVRGQLLVAATFGIAFGCGLWLIGLPFAASIGLAAGVLEVIPYLGGAITVVIAVAVALTIGIPQTILVVVLYAVLINLESHILAPRFIGTAVGLPSVVVLMALFVGLESKGVVGVLLAVPASLVITAILDELWPAPEHSGPNEKDAGSGNRFQHLLLRLRHTIR